MKALNFRKISAVSLFIIIIFILALLIGTSGTAFAVTVDSDVYADLMQMTIDGKKFDVADYPADENGETRMLSFIEYGYSYDESKRDNFRLYVYVYNPRKDVVSTSGQNKIQLATKYDAEGNATDYNKYSLSLVSRSADGLFIKYKVVDDGTIINRLTNRDARRYDVSGIELHINANEVKDYEVGKSYIFTGFAKGLSEESMDESTLKCSVSESETVALRLEHTNFITCYSGYTFAGTQQNIGSVYFSVDNNYLRKYGFLYSLMMSWDKHYCAPILVIDDEDLYAKLSKYSGAVIDTPSDYQPSSYKKALEKAGYDAPSIVNMRFYFYLIASAVTKGSRQVLAPFVIYTGGVRANTVTVTADEIMNYMRNYSKTYVGGRVTINGREYSADVFYDDLDKEYTDVGPDKKEIVFNKSFDIESGKFDLSNNSVLNGFIDTFWDVKSEGNIYNISPIEELTVEKLNQSEADKKLFINSKDLEKVRNYVIQANSEDKTVYIVRYDVSEEVVADFSILGTDPGGYYRVAPVYLGLDVIFLKFFNETGYKVVGAVADPIDIYPDVTPPPYSEWTGNELRDSLTKAGRISVIIAMAVLTVALACLIFTGLYKTVLSKADNIFIRVSLSVVTLVISVVISFTLIFFISVLIYGKVKGFDFKTATEIFWRFLFPMN